MPKQTSSDCMVLVDHCCDMCYRGGMRKKALSPTSHSCLTSCLPFSLLMPLFLWFVAGCLLLLPSFHAAQHGLLACECILKERRMFFAIYRVAHCWHSAPLVLPDSFSLPLPPTHPPPSPTLFSLYKLYSALQSCAAILRPATSLIDAS